MSARGATSGFRVLRRAVGVAAQRVISQPAGLVVAGIFYLMVTSVLSGVWRVAADVNGGSIVGYSTTALVWYIATSEAATIALPQRLIEDVGTDISSGSFTTEMLRPTSPVLMRLATEVGQMLPRLAVCVGAGVVFASVIGGAPIHTGALLLALPSLLLAVTLNLAAQHAFAGSAFWVEEAASAWFLYQKLVFVLGGMLLPLEVLPSSLELVARILPFSAMAYAPARLASGNFEPELLLIQGAWLVVAVGVASRVFTAGERRLLEVGS